jgi:predicted amidohydrolase
MNCRVVLAQIEPTLGNLSANLETHLIEIDAAVKARADMILFPELSLTGYFLRDQTADVALDLDAPALEKLAERSREISIGVGFVERGRDGRVYNSVAFFEDGELLDVHRKVHLVTYGMFDEGRDFACGERFQAFESKHGRFGVLICEDMWHVASSYLHFLNNVDAILVHSSGPGRGVCDDEPGLRSTRVWNKMQDALALLFQTWIVYVNRVGSEDGVFFPGGSRVVDPFGRESAVLEGIEPGRLEAALTSEALRRARVSTPLRRDEKPWIVVRELAKLQSISNRP